MNILTTVLLLLLGWFLGLLTPSITNKIQEEKKAKKIKNGILIETDELKILLATIIYQIESKFNNLNHELINYLLPFYKNYNGVKLYGNILSGLEKFKSMNENELLVLNQQFKKKDLYKVLSLNKINLPYLKTKIHELPILDEELQRKLLNVLMLIDALNEDIEESKFFYKLTFDSNTSDTNHEIINSLIIEKQLFVAKQSRVILSKIDSLKR